MLKKGRAGYMMDIAKKTYGRRRGELEKNIGKPTVN